MKKNLLCCTAIMLFITSIVQAKSPSNTDEHIVWQRAPITVTLPVGQERFITFPSEVKFGYDKKSLPANVLRVENDDQTLYLTALKPFATERVEAKLADGSIILLDMSAQANTDDTPLDIVLASVAPRNTTLSSNNVGKASITYTTLMRYAVQQLYAPKRLLTHSLGIVRFPMQVPHLVPLFYDGSVIAAPLASWRGDDYYVTAVLVKNQLHEQSHLNPRLLCGSWKAASFFPQMTLQSKGVVHNRDTSTLFVISTVPFASAIHNCLQ